MKKISLSRWLDGLDRIPTLYLVGGTVRDLLLDKAPADLDLACRDAKGLAERLALLQGAALVPMEKKPLQPCYRVVDRSDPSKYLDVSELRGGDILEDLSGRDFTFNSIAMEVGEDGSTGRVIDPLGGAEDLRRGLVRMTGTRAFPDDPLRIIRAFRFSAQPGFSIEERTRSAMKDHACLIGRVSAERVMRELFLILGTPRAASVIGDIDGCGVLEKIFPEIAPMKETPQNGFHHRDVWGHSLLVLENTGHILSDLPGYFGDKADLVSENLGRDDRLALLKLAALFHDAGKPGTRGFNSDTGRITFRGHDKAGGLIVDSLAERMKLSSRDRSFIVLLVKEHLRPLFLASQEKTASARMRWFRKLGDDIAPSVILAMADVMSSLGPESGRKYRDDFISWCGETVDRYFGEAKKILERPLLISGDDLIELGMKPGPEIGRILRQVREAQDNRAVTSREEALELARNLTA